MKYAFVKAEWPKLPHKNNYYSFLMTSATWKGEYKHEWIETDNENELYSAIGKWLKEEAFTPTGKGFYRCAWAENEEGFCTDIWVVFGNHVKYEKVNY